MTTAASSANPDQPRLGLSTIPVEGRPLPRALWLHLPLAVAVLTAALHFAAPARSWEWLFREGWGLVELSHVVIPLAATVCAVAAWRRLPAGADPKLSLLLIALAAGSFYIAGEEHSWGQHFFGWQTPGGWTGINRQDETNLHNTTSWLNQKPQTILNTLVALATLVMPLMQSTGRGARLLDRFRFVLPGPETRPAGLLMLFYLIWDQLQKEALVPKIAGRESEMQELFLYLFILLYAYRLLARVRAWHATTAPRPVA